MAKNNNNKAGVAMPAQEAQEQNVKGVRFQSEVVYREDGIVPLSEDGTGLSVGEMIDNQLMSLAENDGEARSFSVSFTKESWEAVKPFYKVKAEQRRYQY